MHTAVKKTDFCQREGFKGFGYDIVSDDYVWMESSQWCDWIVFKKN